MSRESRKGKPLLIFDLDGTLLDFENSERTALTETFSDFDCDLSDEEIAVYTEINKEEWRKFENHSQTKEETTVRRFDRYLDWLRTNPLFGKHLPKRSTEVNDLYLTKLSEIAILEENAYVVLEALSKQGYLLGLLSNGVKKVQERRVELSGLKPFFTHILTSEEAGVGKPHPRIFQMMLERFNTGTTKAIYVGDSWEVDIVGAENAGLEAIWYRKNLTWEIPGNRNIRSFSNWNQFIPLLSDFFQ